MPQFRMYLERADGNEPRRELEMPMYAISMAQALHMGAQYYEVPAHDLVAEQIIAPLRPPITIIGGDEDGGMVTV